MTTPALACVDAVLALAVLTAGMALPIAFGWRPIQYRAAPAATVDSAAMMPMTALFMPMIWTTR